MKREVLLRVCGGISPSEQRSLCSVAADKQLLGGEAVKLLKAFRGAAHSKQALKRGEQRDGESKGICPLMM